MVEIVKPAERAFTLMEVSIAVLILAASLVVIIGLQSSIITKSNHDRMNLQAMLFARRILAQYEANISEISTGEIRGTAEELLKGVESDSDQIKIYAGMDAFLKIEQWDIPQKPQALKRLTVTVSWGDDPYDSMTVFYFVPYEEVDSEEVDEDEDDDDS